MLITWNQKKFLLILFAFEVIYRIINSSWYSYKGWLNSFVTICGTLNNFFIKLSLSALIFLPNKIIFLEVTSPEEMCLMKLPFIVQNLLCVTIYLVGKAWAGNNGFIHFCFHFTPDHFFSWSKHIC